MRSFTCLGLLVLALLATALPVHAVGPPDEIQVTLLDDMLNANTTVEFALEANMVSVTSRFEYLYSDSNGADAIRQDAVEVVHRYRTKPSTRNVAARHRLLGN